MVTDTHTTSGEELSGERRESTEREEHTHTQEHVVGTEDRSCEMLHAGRREDDAVLKVIAITTHTARNSHTIIDDDELELLSHTGLT